MEKLLQYILMATNYQRSGWYDVEKFCNGFTVTNVGDDNVTVNDQILYPGTIGSILGDSRTYGGNRGEIYVGRIKVSFAGVGANPNVEIVQKVYALQGKNTTGVELV